MDVWCKKICKDLSRYLRITARWHVTVDFGSENRWGKRILWSSGEFFASNEAKAGDWEEFVLVKKYILIAGVNGAGKSTLYQTNLNLQGIPRVNTDEILREFGDWKNEKDVLKAGKIAVRKISQYFSEEITFNQETTLCGNSILKNIRMAKQLTKT